MSFVRRMVWYGVSDVCKVYISNGMVSSSFCPYCCCCCCCCSTISGRTLRLAPMHDVENLDSQPRQTPKYTCIRPLSLLPININRLLIAAPQASSKPMRFSRPIYMALENHDRNLRHAVNLLRIVHLSSVT